MGQRIIGKLVLAILCAVFVFSGTMMMLFAFGKNVYRDRSDAPAQQLSSVATGPMAQFAETSPALYARLGDLDVSSFRVLPMAHAQSLPDPPASVAKPAGEDCDYGWNADEILPGGEFVGEKVNILVGNAVEARTDFQLPSPHRMGLSFKAVYNSRSETAGAHGFGWSHSYSLTLDPAYSMGGASYLRIIDEMGRGVYFHEGATRAGTRGLSSSAVTSAS